MYVCVWDREQNSDFDTDNKGYEGLSFLQTLTVTALYNLLWKPGVGEALQQHLVCDTLTSSIQYIDTDT